MENQDISVLGTQDLVGMTREQAIEKIKSFKYTYRVIEDGTEPVMSLDYKTDRFNITVKDDLVTDVKIG